MSIGTLTLNPSITNYYRFDVQALNGSLWELVSFFKITNGWVMKNEYYYRQVGNKTVVTPKEFEGKLYVY